MIKGIILIFQMANLRPREVKNLPLATMLVDNGVYNHLITKFIWEKGPKLDKI